MNETDKLEHRNLKESDWDTLVSWWTAWPEWTAPVKEVLPENGTGCIMIQKNGIPIVAGFIYNTNSASALLEWIISNPEYNDKDKSQAIEILITEVEKTCINMGYKFILTVGRNKSLINAHKKLGWIVDDKPSHEIVKIIG